MEGEDGGGGWRGKMEGGEREKREEGKFMKDGEVGRRGEDRSGEGQGGERGRNGGERGGRRKERREGIGREVAHVFDSQ